MTINWTKNAKNEVEFDMDDGTKAKVTAHHQANDMFAIEVPTGVFMVGLTESHLYIKAKSGLDSGVKPSSTDMQAATAILIVNEKSVIEACRVYWLEVLGQPAKTLEIKPKES
jgi:hypothetical protein